ncbi:MAG: M20/M25/M40 family metallo-hydrolase [Candidatus Aminicenantes bacterium]|nr:M20/M25/M40 family metallo-hydrolase [Candidatus Aminicenantes bacterium]
MKRLISFLCIGLLVFTLNSWTQVKPDGNKAWAHVNHLSSDDFKGRKSGTPEYLKAAWYVAAKMKEFGLKPGGSNDSYFQQVEFKDWRHFEPPCRLKIISPQPISFLPGRSHDFFPNSGTGSGMLNAPLAFAGYGLISKKDQWDDYENLDVSGRIVLLIPGAPDFLSGISAKDKTLDSKIKTAIKKGASGVLLMNIAERIRGWRFPAGAKKGTCPQDFLVMTVNSTALDQIFYLKKMSWRNRVSRMLREKKPCPCLLDIVVEMETHFIYEDRKAPNVLGVIPGKHPELKNEYLMIGGHLDHLGVGLDGSIYNGADDNASSVGVLLEIARVIQANGFRPDRSLVFAAWAGEELGLVGSRYYVEHPIFPLEKTAVYMNIDMVGTGDLDLYVGGMWEFAEFFALLKENMNPKFRQRLKYRIDYRGSDHSAFLAKGVTCISLRSGNVLTRELDDEHPEYHRPGDRAEIIRPELLQQAAEYHYDHLVFLADCRKNLLNPDYHIGFIHKDSTLVDMHCDTIGRAMRGEDLTKNNAKGHIDIPKLKQGAVDLQVFACFVGPPENDLQKNKAATRAFAQIDAVHQLIKQNPEDLILVTSPNDMRQLRGNRKTGILIGIEGGYAIENDLRLLRSFYKNGVRLMTLTHWLQTDWADASGDPEPKHAGLTEFGNSVVREMNRLGMVIDVSHVHDETFWDVMKISDSPVVASHSCCRALSDHHRNLSDKMLKALAKNRGVIGINFLPHFLKADRTERSPETNVKTVVDHIEHVIKVTGNCDHVGLGSDFDGISSTPKGLSHAGELVHITEELVRRGYKDKDIRKILGGNFLRVFREVTSRASR